MKTQNNLLEKYYSGKTTLEEEELLKKKVLSGQADTAEKDIFGYFGHESKVPDNIEEELFAGLEEKKKNKRKVKLWMYKVAAAAAAVVLILSLYLHIENRKKARIESEFLVMEQALYQVSESIQPAEQEEMLVLWVDENVEIIIN
jgi:hypothetical protein